MNFLIGSDPEIFIKDKDGKISSGIGLFKGTKENPIDIGKGCFVQEDNILVEFNIPPVTTFEDFLKTINYSKEYIKTVLAPLGKTLYYSSSEIVDEEVLSKDEAAKVFGCAPSYNIVNQCMTELDITTFSEEQLRLRSSGFHIHFGYDNPNDEMSDKIVLAFELNTTLFLLEQDNDKYNRRSLYGSIGDCRNKEYGVECRSLGGYFLKDDDALKLVWERIQATINFVKEDKYSTEQLIEMIKYCYDEDQLNINKVNKVLKSLNIIKTKELI